MKDNAYKFIAVVSLVYTVWAGFMSDVPHLPVLNETIRNLYFHVPMWFGMIILLFVSMWHSIKYLATSNTYHDIRAEMFARTGIVYGILGLLTGMVWAKFTWGEWWSNDPKQNASAIGLLLYFAYLILRNSFNEFSQKARISSVYNILAFMALIPLLFILPRLVDSLHPGNGGNPGFGNYDLDGRMRVVFYPAILGWTLLGVWITSLKVKFKIVEENLAEKQMIG